MRQGVRADPVHHLLTQELAVQGSGMYSIAQGTGEHKSAYLAEKVLLNLR